MTEDATQNFVDERCQEQKKRSDEARRAYEEKKDPDILVNFIRTHHFAFHEKWVAQAIDDLRRNGRFDLLMKALTPQRGERKEQKQYIIIRNLEIVIMVDDLVKQGMKKEQAFKEISGNQDGAGWESVRKRYYQNRNFKPEIYVEKGADGLVMKAYPTIIEMNGIIRPGSWEMIIPDNGDTTIKGEVICTKERFRNCKHQCTLCPHVEGNSTI